MVVLPGSSCPITVYVVCHVVKVSSVLRKLCVYASGGPETGHPGG